MHEIHESFREEFKSLWEPESPVRSLWQCLEGLYLGLKERAQNQANKLTGYRNVEELERDALTSALPMEKLSVEWVNILWNRIILRTQLKVRDSLQLLFYSSNTGNVYGYTLASRSIVEHVALLEYLATITPWRDGPEVPKEKAIEFMKQLQRLALGSNFDWDKLMKDPGSMRRMLSSGTWKRPREERIPQITTLVRALDEELFRQKRLVSKEQMSFIYSCLCDVVHPSWGGDFIYSPKMYTTLKCSQEFSHHIKLFATLFLLPVVELVRHLILLCDTLEKNELRTMS